jgi:hypothetical protein
MILVLPSDDEMASQTARLLSGPTGTLEDFNKALLGVSGTSKESPKPPSPKIPSKSQSLAPVATDAPEEDKE